jgi:biotin carboxyl carrier protein
MSKRLLLESDAGDWTIEVNGDTVSLTGHAPIAIGQDAGGTLSIEGAAPPVRGAAALDGDAVWVTIDGDVFRFRVSRGARRVARSQARDLDALSPPMSATVVRVLVKPGDRVRQGDPLIALEAMKMELPIRAPRDAVVTAIRCEEGQLVQPGQQLVELDT